MTVAATIAPYPISVDADSPESLSRMTGSCSPISTKSSAFRRKTTISQTASPWTRVCAVVSSDVWAPM